MPGPWRLFVGIHADDAWTAHLGGAAERLRETLGNRVRWVKPDIYHVTVVFLGDHAPDETDRIVEALYRAAASVQPFDLRLRALRHLGSPKTGALVVGVDDASGALQRLRARLDAELRRAGVEFDSKPLVPHLTLGRPRNGPPFELPSLDLSSAPPLTVHEVCLIRSDLQAGGPAYSTVSAAPLGLPLTP